MAEISSTFPASGASGWRGRRERAAMAGRSVTLRALSILDAFDATHRRLRLTEIASRAELPLATAHRHIRELVDWQALERREDGSYQIGSRLWHLGLLSPMHAELRELALPHLQDLYAATGATVHLAVREGAEALYVERLGGVRSVPVVSRPGGTLPLHATAVGKVLLAWAPSDARRSALARLRRLTPYTVVQPARLAAQLDEVRRTGAAWTREEMVVGASSIAVGVAAADGVTAAVGLVMPSTRPNIWTGLPALRAAAAAIGARLQARDDAEGIIRAAS
jgi:DNA-binding IclR family transcriptional regulator